MRRAARRPEQSRDLVAPRSGRGAAKRGKRDFDEIPRSFTSPLMSLCAAHRGASASSAASGIQAGHLRPRIGTMLCFRHGKDHHPD